MGEPDLLFVVPLTLACQQTLGSLQINRTVLFLNSNSPTDDYFVTTLCLLSVTNDYLCYCFCFILFFDLILSL